MKDISSNGILGAYDLPDDEFDTYIETTLTNRHTKETIGHPKIYTILPPKTHFDFPDESVKNTTRFLSELSVSRLTLVTSV